MFSKCREKILINYKKVFEKINNKQSIEANLSFFKKKQNRLKLNELQDTEINSVLILNLP